MTAKYTGTSATMLWLKAREATPGFWKLEEGVDGDLANDISREIARRASVLAAQCCAAMGHEVGAESEIGEFLQFNGGAGVRFVRKYYCDRCGEQIVFERSNTSHDSFLHTVCKKPH